jgi:4-hydroxy-3-methylbut-2-enyl diphosphate reductase
VVTVEKALELYGPPIYVRKQIVHNVHVVADLERRGAIFVDETDEVPDGSRLVFSAHGVAPSVHEEAQRLSLLTIDATCPLVTKVHNEAKRFADSGYQILLIGHEGHEEVEGTAGEAPDAITIVDSPDAVDDLEIDPDRPVAWLSQTTLSVDETMQTVERLRTRLPMLIDPPSDDICYATQNRQAAVKEIAPQCDVVIVVGSENSSNSVRLAEVAQEAGARSYRIDDAGQLQPEWLEGAESVGVTSGASVPESLVEQLLDALEELGFDEIELVKTVEESLIFALPPELRRDIKAASAR